MKRLFFAAVLFSASTVTFAQSSEVATPAEAVETTIAAPAETVAADDRKEVKIADLPAAVQKELGTAQYKGWTPSSAWWISEGKTEYYKITLVMGNETKDVKYNAEGSKLD